MAAHLAQQRNEQNEPELVSPLSSLSSPMETALSAVEFQIHNGNDLNRQHDSHRAPTEKRSTTAFENQALLGNDEQLEKRWPTEPSRLARTSTTRRISMAWDLFLALLPLIFITLAVLAAYLNQKELSKFGSMVSEAVTGYGPTIFPYVFAGLASNMLAALVQFYVERGSSVGFLDLLFGSRSVVRTIATVWGLRETSFIGVFIILLWKLSPIGGQSARRIMVEGNATVTSFSPVHYFAFNQTSPANTWDSFNQPITALFSSSMMGTASWNTPRDPWSNIKLPMIEELQDPNNEGWFTVNGENNNTYSSLLGIPLSGLQRAVNMSMLIQFGYFVIQCAEIINSSKSPSEDGETYRHDILDNLIYHFPNGTQKFSAPVDDAHYQSWFMDTTTPTALEENPEPRKNETFPPVLIFASRNNGFSSLALATCNITYKRVEAKGLCDDSVCGVTYIRYAKTVVPDTRTPLDRDLPRSIQTFQYMSYVFPKGMPQLYELSSSPFEFYLNGSLAPYSQAPTLDTTDCVELEKVDPTTFSQRLTILFNTMWHSTHAAQYTPTLAPQFQAGVYQGSAYGFTIGDNSSNLVANATVVRTRAVYITKPVWVVFLLLASLVLEACAIIAIIVKWNFCTGPDILGYVSTMTRDSVHTPLPPGGSTLSGAEGSRLLKNYVVQLADTKKGQDVGTIGLCARDATESDYERLRRDKLYS